MKKFVSVTLTLLLAISLFGINVLAVETEDILISRSVEVMENGDYIVTELYLDAVQPYAGTSGHRTATWVNALGTNIWTITVNGTFTYTYGVSSKATSSSAVVEIFNNNATFVSKNAYTSDNTATATATVRYSASNSSLDISVSCDKYGNLY